MPRRSGSGRGRRHYSYTPRIRKNERIRVREVRVIDPDGKQIGVMATEQARRLARQQGLDLVEIAPTARPPVCRILDFGKYMYEQSKKGKDSKPQSSKIKEVRLRVRVEQHDYLTKLRRAEEFLGKGNKVKLSLMFRGREMEHQDLGFDVVNRAIGDLSHIGGRENEPRLVGRNITAVLAPLPPNRRKLKFNMPEAVGEAS